MADGAVLITGGAGYIGSHAVLAFRDAGHEVIVLDNLTTGRRAAVPGDVVFVEGDAGNGEAVEDLIRKHEIDAVVHFAGSIVVPESVTNPLKYYGNNTCVSRNLIQACIEGGVENFIFSSTAAVYGIPAKVPVAETAPTAPINPYGASKLMVEGILRDVAAATDDDFNYLALRYFNVAGADPAGRTGQSTPNATHLIKIASAVAVGRRNHIDVYGEDYDTPDGTCIRDYIHVSDLAAAHVDALHHLMAKHESLVLNCGYGRGYSVREVLAAVEQEAGVSLNIRPAARRAGDPPCLVADADAIGQHLGWQPKHNDLNEIVRSALAWERKLADGPHSL